MVLQEHPAFVVFSKGEQGGAALVRSILNRAVGAPQDAVKQVRQHIHLKEDTERELSFAQPCVSVCDKKSKLLFHCVPV